MTPARGHDLTGLKRVLLAGNHEILARALVILAATTGVLLIAGQMWVALWTASYLLWAFVYTGVVRRLPDSVGRAGLILVILFEALVTLHWPFLFVRLWSMGDMAYRCIALLVIAAAMTNAMGNRSGVLILRTSDLMSVSVLMGLLTYLIWHENGSIPQTVTLGVISVLLLVWLSVSLREVSGLRLRLTQAERADFDRQRIESIGRLTGGVAHDFNNILTVIGGNLDLAREVPDEAEKQALLTEARTATARAAAVTAQLLAYSRQAVLMPVDTDIAPSLVRVQGFLARLLPPDLVLTMTPAVGLPSIRLDPTRFETALINLILNARDAMPQGGVITVAAHLTERPDGVGLSQGNYLCVTVSDEGTGIDPAIIARVAEPYFTTKPIGRGSGLGLSMVKGFVEQSGGAFDITSRLGVGTRVRLFFPVTDQALAISLP
jgi:signal transduction histidine kinase